MTALDLTPVQGRGRLRWALSDAWIVCRRNLIQIPRMPEIMAFSIINPVMFVVLFVYVLGGAIPVPGFAYKDYLMPGIFVQTTIFGAVTTGVGLAEDVQRGLVDRFRSLPMSRGALLTGRTLADLIRSYFVVMVMVLVGFLVGFRFHTGLLSVYAGLALLLLFAYAFGWVAATVGLSVGSAEAAQSGGFIWVFPFTFASSALVPTATMPGWLQAFSAHQPVTVTVNAVRALFLGGPAATDAFETIGYSVLLLIIFVPLATRAYKRAAMR